MLHTFAMSVQSDSLKMNLVLMNFLTFSDSRKKFLEMQKRDRRLSTSITHFFNLSLLFPSFFPQYRSLRRNAMMLEIVRDNFRCDFT